MCCQCEFGRKHPFLVDLVVTRKLKLWDRVVAECSLLDHCPSSASNLFAFTILPKVDEFGDVEIVMAHPRRTTTSTSTSTSYSCHHLAIPTLSLLNIFIIFPLTSSSSVKPYPPPPNHSPTSLIT